MDCNSAMENAAVLPVPGRARAMTSRPTIIGTMALCWIAEGRSKPLKKSILLPKTRRFENRKSAAILQLTTGVNATNEIFAKIHAVESTKYLDMVGGLELCRKRTVARQT